MLFMSCSASASCSIVFSVEGVVRRYRIRISGAQLLKMEIKIPDRLSFGNLLPGSLATQPIDFTAAACKSKRAVRIQRVFLSRR